MKFPRQFPKAWLDFEVYEDAVNYIGVAKVTLPTIAYASVENQGAGVGGKVETPLIGMTENMTLGLQFYDVTRYAVNLLSPKKHKLELRAAEQYWDANVVDAKAFMDKYVAVVMPKSTNLGDIGPMSEVNVSGEYNVFYFAAYHSGVKRMEIDKFNQICLIDGVDHFAELRRLLGK